MIGRDREVSADAADRVEILLDSIARIMSRESKRLQAQADREKEGETFVFPQLPNELRWRVMVLGSSVEDINLWIRRDRTDDGDWYLLTEIETGVEVGGVGPLEACERYFKDDVLDHR